MTIKQIIYVKGTEMDPGYVVGLGDDNSMYWWSEVEIGWKILKRST